MRRISIAMTSVIALALACAAPGVAFGHGARQHGRHHKHHHARGARIIRYTPTDGSEGSSPETGTSGESIGTVSSYEKEVLTIKLTDGSQQSGKVTAHTRVICVSSASTEGSDDHDFDHDGDWWGGWHGNDSCAEPSSQEGTTEAGWQDSGHGWGGSDRGDCVQAKEEVDLEKVLVAGAVVKEAELALTPAGAIWQTVVISR